MPAILGAIVLLVVLLAGAAWALGLGPFAGDETPTQTEQPDEDSDEPAEAPQDEAPAEAPVEPEEEATPGGCRHADAGSCRHADAGSVVNPLRFRRNQILAVEAAYGSGCSTAGSRPIGSCSTSGTMPSICSSSGQICSS